MILNPAAQVRILSGGQYTIRLRSLHRAYLSLHPFGVVHWVPEQRNIKAVTGACKLIDGCSLELCSATPSVASSGICHRNKVNSIAWLSWWPCHETVSVTFIHLHNWNWCINLHIWCTLCVMYKFAYFMYIYMWLMYLVTFRWIWSCIHNLQPKNLELSSTRISIILQNSENSFIHSHISDVIVSFPDICR